VTGRLKAETAGGHITARLASAPDADLAVTGGSLQMEIPRNAGFTLRAKAVGGSVSLVDLVGAGAVQVDDFNGPVNGGGSTQVSARTAGGNMEIRGV
jgi:hypothetical protein